MASKYGAMVPTLVAKHEGGMRFSAEIRGHKVMTDQPVPSGADSAVMPLELLGSALGTCIALYVHHFLASRGLPTEGMRAEVVALGAPNPNRIGRFEVEVVLPEGVPESYRPMIERVARSCPAHATLQHPPEIVIEVAEEPVGAPR